MLCRLLQTFPVPYAIYDKCLELEELGVASEKLGVASGSVDMQKLRGLYERALRDYGTTRVGKVYMLRYLLGAGAY